MDGSGGKGSFVIYIYITLQEREVEVLVNYDHPIVEIEARKKKEVDDEQQGSSRVEGEILHEAAAICELSDAELFKHWFPCLRAFSRTSINGLSTGRYRGSPGSMTAQ